MLAEWAGRATIDADEVVAERGVVREEFRLRREQAGAAVNDAFDRVYFDGTPYEDRTPSGAEQQIMATDASDVRAFYDRWYRPDLMAVVAVGDLPLDDLEDYVTHLLRRPRPAWHCPPPSHRTASGDRHPPAGRGDRRPQPRRDVHLGRLSAPRRGTPEPSEVSSSICGTPSSPR